MRSFLSRLNRTTHAVRRSQRRSRPWLESLEDRFAPSVSSLYLSIQTPSGSLLDEYTPTGVLVRSVPVPVAGFPEVARDLAVTGNQVHVYNGTFSPLLSTYDGATGSWTNTAGPDGWGTINNQSYGGLAALGGFAFASDMAVAGETTQGIVRFNLGAGTADRFATDFAPVDVAAGLDGSLYALNAAGTIRVYDPSTLSVVRTLTLPAQVTPAGASGPVTQDYRALAVAANGTIYAADWNRTLTRFAADGATVLACRTLPSTFMQGPGVANLTDVDIVPADTGDGQLAVGSTNGVVAIANASTVSYFNSFQVGTGPTFVAVGAPLAELNIADADPVVEGDAGTTTTARFTVTLSNPVAQQVFVRWTTSSFVSAPAAAAGTDYQSIYGSLTFEPGETARTVDIVVNGDNDDELDERFTVVLQYYPSGAVLNRTTGYATIVDDDAPPTATPVAAGSAGNAVDAQHDGTFESFTNTTGPLNEANVTGSQGRAVLEFNTSSAPVSAPYVTLDVYEESGTNQSAAVSIYGYVGEGTATVADATAPGAVLLGTLDPTTGTAWRRVVLDRSKLTTLMAQSPYVGILISGPMTSGVTIRGTGTAEAPRLTFWSSAPPAVPVANVSGTGKAEGNPGGAATLVAFDITINPATTAVVAVSYQTVDGTAKSSSDYTATSGTVTFAPGEAVKTVYVPVTADLNFEVDETFGLVLSNPVNTSLRITGAAGTILNDDTRPTISVAAASATEPDTGTANLNITASLSAASYEAITVNYAATAGAATAGGDFLPVGGTITFAPGETTKTVAVPMVGDRIDEPDETLTLTLSDPRNATLGTASATGTILDNDPTPAISVFAGSAVTEGGTRSYSVVLSNASAWTITVDYTTADGSATAGADYVAKSGTLTIAPGSFGQTVSVQTLQDAVDEPNETVLLRLANATNATIQTGEAAGTINDDDPAPTPAVDAPSVAEGDGGTTQMVFTVSLSNPSSQSLTMDYATVAGSAAEGDDYQPTSGTLTFAPGETSNTVAVAVSGDTVYEPAETLSLLVNYAGGTYAGTGTIINDDALPTVTAGSVSVAEGDASTTDAVFTVSLSNPSYQTISVDYRTADGSATAAAADFIYAAGTVTFSPGETSKTVTAQVRGDTIYEPDETFALALANPSNAAAGADGTATIRNDDPLPAVHISTGSLAEGNSATQSMVFTITLANPSYQTVTLDYATADTTATAGSDYQATSGTLTFAPMETGKQVQVVVSGDNVYEGNETFVVRLSNPANATFAESQADGIIVDDDWPTVTGAPASVTEGNSGTVNLVFTLTLSNPSVEPVVVNYVTADGTAQAGSDYAAASGSVTIAPGATQATVTVPVIGDTRVEADETLTLRLSLPAGTNANLVNNTLAGTIVNDDLPSVSVAGASVAEGDTGTTYLAFPVTLSDPFTRTVTVDYSTSDGTAIAGDDYLAVSGTLTFTPGETSKTILVSVIGDTWLEANDTLRLTLANPANATLGAATATGTIINDDYAPVASAGPDQTVNEGVVVQFDASASSDADQNALSFSWNFGDQQTSSGAKPTHAYADDGVYTATVTVNDGHGGVSSDSVVITVKNVAPTAAISGAATAVRGQSRTFTLTASDPAPADRAAPMTYRVTWGDGTAATTVAGPASGVTVTHTFPATGTVTVSVTAADQDGAVGPAAALGVAVKAVEVQSGDLIVGGTTAGDQISLSPANATGGVRVVINGADVGSYTPSGQIVVYAQAGDDNVSFATTKISRTTYAVGQPVLLFGGDGSDTLDAHNAAGAAVLLGGAGADTLFGGGRAILIGGIGKDTLNSGADDTILIGGTTTHDDNLTALAALRAEWSRSDANYDQRIAHLSSPSGGNNGSYVLTPATVQDDGAANQLSSGNGQDWFFQGVLDQLLNRRKNETVTRLF